MDNNQLLKNWLEYEHKHGIWELCGGKDKGLPEPQKNFAAFPSEEVLNTMEKIFFGKEVNKFASKIKD